MYLKKVHIQNIKSIKDFEMEFEEPAGWHVLIGDNGSGKSTILRAIALGLIGKDNAMALRANWKDWLSIGATDGRIELDIEPSSEDFEFLEHLEEESSPMGCIIDFSRDSTGVSIAAKSILGHTTPFWALTKRWFSCSFGPFRKFVGGNDDWRKVFQSFPRLGSHLHCIEEGVPLTEAIDYLMKLKFRALDTNTDPYGIAEKELSALLDLFNSPDFLPNGIKISGITAEGIYFSNAAGQKLSLDQLSDGYRAILSMTIEIIRQMVVFYGHDQVFSPEFLYEDGVIDLPGVVLIDEIDVHLHPSWQLKIGEWFLKYFPKIQFIVTTHSPLICRASEKGSVWHLSADGSENGSPRISKLEYERLVYGNILDAYGTELFGASTVRSQKSNEKLKRLGRLNMLAAFGKITEEEEIERRELQLILSTDDPFGA